MTNVAVLDHMDVDTCFRGDCNNESHYFFRFPDGSLYACCEGCAKKLQLNIPPKLINAMTREEFEVMKVMDF